MPSTTQLRPTWIRCQLVTINSSLCRVSTAHALFGCSVHSSLARCRETGACFKQCNPELVPYIPPKVRMALDRA